MDTFLKEVAERIGGIHGKDMSQVAVIFNS